MKTLTKAVLLAALFAGAAPLATPALAKSAPAPAGPTLKVSEKVRTAQDAAVKALNAASAQAQGGVTAANRDAVVAAFQAADAPIAQVEVAATTPDEQYVAARLRYEKESRQNAARFFDNQAGAAQASVAFAPYLDKLLASPSTPPADLANYAYERGEIAVVARQPDKALVFFQRAKTAGNTSVLNEARIVEQKIQLRDYAGAAADGEPLIAQLKAQGITPPESYYLVIIEQAYQSKNTPLAVSWEIKHLQDYPAPTTAGANRMANWHDALVRLLTRSTPKLDSRQEIEVFRLMRTSGALADEKERRLYAQDLLDTAATREAQAILSEANLTQPDSKTLLTQAKTRAAAAPDPAKQEAAARSASDFQSAFTAGNFYLSAGQYPKAVELYQLAISRNPPDADTANMNLGIAQALAGDKAGATATFQKVQKSPRKETAAYWIAWLARP